VSDQAKSFKSREFTQELTKPCKHLILLLSISAIFEDFVE